jgi:hypothetical protein
MRIFSLMLAGLLLGGELKAHDVIWEEDYYDGSFSSIPMDFDWPSDLFDYISVTPSANEPCIVVVNLYAQSSTLIKAQVLPPNPANEVDIMVVPLRAPSNHLETATVSGEWHATGLPVGYDCTATNPNPFFVPVTVSDSNLVWGTTPAPDKKSVNIDTKVTCTLQAADKVTGPWLNVGIGQMFKINMDMTAGFFQRFKRIGGFLSGTVTDNSGNPLPNIYVGLLHGGATATTDATGVFSFLSRLPWGMNLIAFTNPIGASLNIAVPNTNNNVVVFKLGMAGGGPATNACNCTPWCAIGFGTFADGETPVYYSGGANPPSSGTANCGEAVVSVTTPGGVTFPITPGTQGHQNSGDNPVPGTWTVTATVCGQTKSATVTVP